MKRSLFFIIVAVLGLLFGGMMLVASDKAAEGFGLTSNPVIALLFRILGSAILSSGLLNFLVRNDANSNTLKAVLIFNIVFHGIGMCVDLSGVSSGVLEFGKIVPGLISHLFIGIGSIVYVMRIRG